MSYLRTGGFLYVTGDLGNATYMALGSFKSWAECDLTYFSGKCVASEDGAQYRAWDPDYLKLQVIESLKESEKTWHNFCSRNGDSALSSEQEWIAWAAIYGSDFWDEPSTYPYGKRISTRCHAHLIGLKMAMKQFNKDFKNYVYLNTENDQCTKSTLLL